MSRPLRIEFPGAFYHVTSRGDRREAIFEDDVDREAFLETFRSVIEGFEWHCHAYCLMTNHYHLFVQTIHGDLSKGMRQLNGVYTQWSLVPRAVQGHLGRYRRLHAGAGPVRRLESGTGGNGGRSGRLGLE